MAKGKGKGRASADAFPESHLQELQHKCAWPGCDQPVRLSRYSPNSVHRTKWCAEHKRLRKKEVIDNWVRSHRERVNYLRRRSYWKMKLLRDENFPVEKILAELDRRFPL